MANSPQYSIAVACPTESFSECGRMPKATKEDEKAQQKPSYCACNHHVGNASVSFIPMQCTCRAMNAWGG